MAIKKPENLSFEEALSELELIVAELENSELPLEQSLKQYQRGIGLANASQQKLEAAQQQIKILKQADAQAPLDPFHEDAIR